jgi:methyl-accepting chemotaxis protein
MKLKQRLSLQQKILVMVIGASIIIYAIAIGYISLKFRNTALNQAISLTDAYAEKYSSNIKYMLEEDLITVRSLIHSVSTYKTMPQKQWKELFASMYEKSMEENPQFLSIWDSWELNNIEPNYKKDFGRYVCEFWRENGKIKHNTSLKDLTGDASEYARIKRDKIECLENPYVYSYSGNEKDNQQMTSLIVPMLENGKYIGVVGVDISLNRYHPIINQIKPIKGSFAFLIANDLHYVAHPSIDKVGALATDDYESLFSKHSITDKIVNGEPTSFIDNDITGIKSYFTFKPIIVGKTVRPWSLVIVVPQSSILEDGNRNFIISIIVGIVGLFILFAVIYYTTKTIIVSPILSITQMLNRLSKGNIGNDLMLEFNQDDEVGQMATALNLSIEGLSKKSDFAHNIGQGDLNAELNLLSDEDLLGKSLIHMRESLKTAQEEENIRKIEDEKRQWTNAGLAKFGEILRQNNDKLDVLASEIIKNLVHYINANQGGLFIYNDDESENIHFELLSAFAYNRHKFLKKQILVGEGLVGTCALEKKTIYLTEIPENYIQIGSGLGEALPRCLLIVPLLIEEKVLGILELASFNEIEPYQIEFIEKLAQSIASTLTSVRTNIRTTLLLTKTQQQAEEMSAQEEEMRQNMEELQATQEEAARKTAEMQSYIEAINNSSFLIEYDSKGYIQYINDAYINLLHIPREKLIGTHHSYKMEFDAEHQREYDKFWNDILNGVVKKVTNTFTIDDFSYTFDETYTPLLDEQGMVYKIIKIANNISK